MTSWLLAASRRLADADRCAFETVRARRTCGGIKVARAVSALAEPRVVYPVLAVAGVVAAVRPGSRPGGASSAWWRVGAPCVTVAAGAVARRQVSRAIARPRPPRDAWLTMAEGFSLPSRHTTLAVLAAGSAVRALGVRGAPARAVPLLAAAGVGGSRVYLGVHWPGDVIAGWLFAEGWLRLTRDLPPPWVCVRYAPPPWSANELKAASGYAGASAAEGLAARSGHPAPGRNDRGQAANGPCRRT